MKNLNNFVGGGDQFFNKPSGKTKRGGKTENTEVVGVMRFFHFHLFTISYHGN